MIEQSQFLTDLQAIDDRFRYGVMDNYANPDFTLDWLENDLYAVHEIDRNEGTILVDVMTEKQIIKFLDSYYNL